MKSSEKVFQNWQTLQKKRRKLGIENCLMDGTWEHATRVTSFQPESLEVMFEEVKNDNLV